MLPAYLAVCVLEFPLGFIQQFLLVFLRELLGFFVFNRFSQNVFQIFFFDLSKCLISNFRRISGISPRIRRIPCGVLFSIYSQWFSLDVCRSSFWNFFNNFSRGFSRCSLGEFTRISLWDFSWRFLWNFSQSSARVFFKCPGIIFEISTLDFYPNSYY